MAFCKPVEFLGSVDFEEFDAVLSVGTNVKPELPWTTINSNGWRARVSSGNLPLAGECSLENPIGALACSCLGVGEVFKRLIALVPERGTLLNGMSFSLLDFDSNSDECGPPLPLKIEHDLLVVGGGAIGNGIIALLCRLPIFGIIEVVDRERFGEENLGTCMLVGPEHLNQPKAPTLEAMLKAAGKQARGFEGEFVDYVATLDGKYPAVVLNGLDNIDVRHEVQRALWPDLIVDGAIGDFGCQVSRHPWNEDAACLICLFKKPVRSGEVIASEASGLAEDRVRQADELVTTADVDAAPERLREYLRARIGRPICSVVSEAVTQKISQDAQVWGHTTGKMWIPSNETAFPAKFSFGLVNVVSRSKILIQCLPKASSTDETAQSLLMEKRNLAAQHGWLLFEFSNAQVKNDMDGCLNAIEDILSY